MNFSLTVFIIFSLSDTTYTADLRLTYCFLYAAKYNIGAVLSLWAPVILVCLSLISIRA